MAPVISTMSDFISGGIRWTPRCTAGSRWLGILTSTVLSLSPHGPSERSKTLSLLLSPYFDLPVLHNSTAATPLQANVFCIIRHQRPVLLMTAARVSNSYISRLKKKKTPAFFPVFPWSQPLRNEYKSFKYLVSTILFRIHVMVTIHCLISFIFLH